MYRGFRERTYRLDKIEGINLEYCSFEDARFILEVKVLPNYWVPVHKYYPDVVNLVSHFRTQEDASFVKGSLKKLLRGEIPCGPGSGRSVSGSSKTSGLKTIIRPVDCSVIKPGTFLLTPGV